MAIQIFFWISEHSIHPVVSQMIIDVTQLRFCKMYKGFTKLDINELFVKN